MEKIKNILNPGKSQDDEVMYGTGQAPSQGFSGAGTHLGSTDTPSENLLPGNTESYPKAANKAQYGSGTGQTAGPHSSDIANKADPRVDSDLSQTDRTDPTTEGTTTTAQTHQHTAPRDNASVASIKSGVPGTDTTGTRREPAVGDTDLNKPLPQAPVGERGTESGLTGAALPERTRASGTAGAQGGTNEPHFGESGVDRNPAVGSTAVGQNSRTDPSHTTGGTTTAGPHSSNIANKADPRVDSDRDGSQTVGTTGTTGTTQTTGTTGTVGDHHTPSHRGEEALAGAGAGALGAGAYEHEKHHDGRNTTGGKATEPGSDHPPAFSGIRGPHPTDTGNRLDPNTPSEPRTGGTSTGGLTGGDSTTTPSAPAGTTTEPSTGSTTGPHKSSILNKLDPRVKNTSTNEPDTTTTRDHHAGATALGGAGAGAAAAAAYEHHNKDHTSTAASTGPTATGTNAPTGTSEYTTPYSSSPADPRIDNTPRTGTTGQTTGQTTGDHHYGRDAAAGTAAAGGLAYEADKHHDKHHDHKATETGPTGTTTTAGPHSSDLANRADPRVDSDRSKETTTDHHGHHHGRDAAAGTAAAGGLAYEADKHHDKHQDHRATETGTTGTTTTAGPHSSDLANKTDPRVDSDRSKETTTGHHGHHARDSGVAGLGAGAVGTTAYEADRERDPAHQPSTGAGTAQTTAGPHSSDIANKADPRVDSDQSKKDHHYGRDAALAGGAGGVAAHEHSKHDKAEEKALAKEERKEEKREAKEERREEKREEKEERREEKREEKEEKKGGGLLGFLHKDKSKDTTTHHDKHHEKETVAAEEEREPKKHGGVLGFLHKDKSKDATHDTTDTERTAATGAAVGTGAVAEHEGRNRLHKDPPADHPAAATQRDSVVTEPTTGLPMDTSKASYPPGTHIGTDGPIGASYDDPSRTGQSGAGPHSSSLENKADPRVDSTTGQQSSLTGHHTGTTGTTGTTGASGTTTTTGETGTTWTAPTSTVGETGAGPHSSSLANKADPRIDSTTGQGSTTTGHHSGTTGTTGATGASDTTGTTGTSY